MKLKFRYKGSYFGRPAYGFEDSEIDIFTGFKDCLGEDIYENDELKALNRVKNRVGKVEMINGSFRCNGFLLAEYLKNNECLILQD